MLFSIALILILFRKKRQILSLRTKNQLGTQWLTSVILATRES
jgi:hypothetical protein